MLTADYTAETLAFTNLNNALSFQKKNFLGDYTLQKLYLSKQKAYLI